MLAVALGGCTSSPDPVPDPSFGSPSVKPGPVVAVSFVGTLDDPADTQYLDAARLAVQEVNEGPDPIRLTLSVVDDGGDAGRARESVLAAAESATAILYAGPGAVLRDVRAQLEPTQVPVVLLGGDLYTTRDLYSNVFQASHPLLWQARVIAKYLFVRGEDAATALLDGTELEESETAWTSAAAEEGIGSSPDEPAIPDGFPVVVLGDVGQAPFGVPAPQILATNELFATPPDATLRPGTVVVESYAWSGWAEPIKRVKTFRDAFRAEYGRLPMGLEQQGYDAARLLGLGLADTEGAGGRELIARLEQIKYRLFSYMGIRLGPDDHTFYDDWTLGMFAVAGPDEPVDAWMEGATPWRPIMRTFSYDLERTTIWERDRGPFFPNWHEPAPSPKYWWSRLGIITRPGDPLH